MSAATLRNPVAPLEHYRAAFEARWASKDDALTSLRRAALERFLASGFPTQRHEDWKYTNLRRLEMRKFALAETTALSLDAAQDRWIPEAGIRIVLVNGHWMPALGSAIAQSPGVTLLTLAQWSSHDPAEVAAFLSSAAGSSDNAFEQLNLAFCEDGVVINIADGIKAEPIYIVHQCNEYASQRMSHPRVIVRAGRNSQCTLIEQFVGPDVEYFTNAVSVIDVGSGASVRHYRLQQESARSFHVAQVNVRQQSDSRYTCHDVSLGASLGRTNITTLLEGTGAHVGLHGLFAPTGTQHLDVHTRIEHIAPHTTSDEDYRGVAAGRGRGVFNGKVIVHPGAQKIDARQSSRNLLLSPNAEIDTKPELEIYAHDVKCSHGATTGQLDATALFYLRSRGLSEAQARALLIRAFVESILSTVEHEPLRVWLEQRLDERFAAPSEVSA